MTAIHTKQTAMLTKKERGREEGGRKLDVRLVFLGS